MVLPEVADSRCPQLQEEAWFWAGFGWSCIKKPVEQIWVICAGAAATRLVDVPVKVGIDLGLLFTRHFHFVVANEAGD